MIRRVLGRALALWRATLGLEWRVAYVEDPPTSATPGTVYVVGTRRRPFQAVMACPCGCQEQIWMDLVPGDGDHWTVRRGWTGSASLAPSIWRTAGCRSHFWLRSGGVRWC